MVMPGTIEVTDIEQEVLEDMTFLPLHVGNVLDEVRKLCPDAMPAEARRVGRDLLASWIARGWLEVASRDGQRPPVGIDGLLAFVDKRPLKATADRRPWVWLRLTDRAYLDVPALERDKDPYYEPPLDERVVAQFRRKQLVQLVAALAGLGALLWFMAQAKRAGAGPNDLGMGLAIVFVAAWVWGVSLLNWRCPSCRAYLGRPFNPRTCPKCSGRLR